VKRGVERRVERRSEIKPYRIAHPVKLEVRFNEAEVAEIASYLPGVERPTGNTVVFTGRDMVEVSKFKAVLTNLRAR
jgi:D-amino peptidase